MTQALQPQSVSTTVGVVMLGLMGDVLMRTPVLRELRKALPAARICCIVDPIGAEVLKLTEGADELIVTHRSKKPRLRYYTEKLKLYTAVAARGFDVMIDLYGGLTGKSLVKVSRAPLQLIVGFNTVSANTSLHQPALESMRFANPYHLSNPLLRAMAAFRYEHQSLDTTPWCTIDSIKSPCNIESVLGLLDRKEFFLLSLGSGDPRKTTDRTRIADMIEYLYKDRQIQCAVVCNPGQEWLQTELCDLLGKRTIEHVALPPLHLAELAWLMRKARFCVLPDSGLYHLALGMHAPVLGLFTHTNPELVRPEHEPYEICFKVDSSKGRSPMHGLPYGSQDLTSDDLVSAVDRLLHKIT